MSQSPTINFIILFYSTSNTTLFFVLPNLAKLAQDGKAAYNFSIKRTKKQPFFPELSGFIKTDHFYLNIPSTAMGIRKKYDSNFIFTFAVVRSDTAALQRQNFLNMETI